MPTPYEIPLSAKPQSFNITLAGVQYNLTVKWNMVNATWVLDIADDTKTLLVGGIPLVTGVDLLGQYQYLGINGVLIVQSDYDADALPTIDNLGTNSQLIFITNS